MQHAGAPARWDRAPSQVCSLSSTRSAGVRSPRPRACTSPTLPCPGSMHTGAVGWFSQDLVLVAVMRKAGLGPGAGQGSPACLPGFGAGRCLLDSNFGNPGGCCYTQGDALIPMSLLCEKTAPVSPYRKSLSLHPRTPVELTWAEPSREGAEGSAGARVPAASADVGDG